MEYIHIIWQFSSIILIEKWVSISQFHRMILMWYWLIFFYQYWSQYHNLTLETIQWIAFTILIPIQIFHMRQKLFNHQQINTSFPNSITLLTLFNKLISILVQYNWLLINQWTANFYCRIKNGSQSVRCNLVNSINFFFWDGMFSFLNILYLIFYIKWNNISSSIYSLVFFCIN